MDEAIKHIQSELDRQIDSFNKRIKSNKRKAFYFKLITLGLSFSATLALGIKGWGDPDVLKNWALIFTAMITFFSSVDMYFNHKGLWVRYVETRNELTYLDTDFKYYVASNNANIDKEEIDEFHERMQSILNTTSSWWSKERQKKQV